VALKAWKSLTVGKSLYHSLAHHNAHHSLDTPPRSTPDRTTSALRLLQRMGLNRLDFAIIAVYLVGITLFGLRFRKRQRSLRD